MISRHLLLGASALVLAAGSAAAQTTIVGTNQSTILQTGTGNQAEVNNTAPGNDNNASTVSQNGFSNLAIVEQVGDLNISRLRQAGSENRGEHRQNGNRNTVDAEQTGDRHNSRVTQQGDDNDTIVSQANGNRNGSIIAQAAVSTARATQRGSDNASEVTQRGSHQAATVVQGQALLLSQGNSSQISQDQRGQQAEVFQYEGSTAARNLSSIVQRNQFSATATSNNRASVAMRGFGNNSLVTQNGSSNLSELSILGGGTAAGAATDAESGRTQGNRASVAQTGTGLTARVSMGRVTEAEGQGNFNQIEQANGGTAPANQGHRADLWQRGLFETVAIRQGDTSPDRPTQQPIAYSDGTRGRSVADVSQRGVRGSIDVRQYGDNSAEVTQGLGTKSTILVSQVDAGDFEVTVPEQTLRAFNSTAIAQYGDGNRVGVEQDSINARAVVFQQTGTSSNTATVVQGASIPEIAVIGPPKPPRPTGSATMNLTTRITQGGTRNFAAVGQWGTSLEATVEQSGSGAPMMHNRVNIEQLGQANRATARQTAGVGPSAATDPASGLSGDEFYFGGGARSAEIAIIQSSSSNSATVEQRGRGQFARIEQSGQSNSGAILQLEAATNATAVLRQSGNGNSYTIEQGQAGQYLVVSQTGNNNAVTTTVQRGPGS